jgi:hypothetical protein
MSAMNGEEEPIEPEIPTESVSVSCDNQNATTTDEASMLLTPKNDPNKPLSQDLELPHHHHESAVQDEQEDGDAEELVPEDVEEVEIGTEDDENNAAMEEHDTTNNNNNNNTPELSGTTTNVCVGNSPFGEFTLSLDQFIPHNYDGLLDYLIDSEPAVCYNFARNCDPAPLELFYSVLLWALALENEEHEIGNVIVKAQTMKSASPVLNHTIQCVYAMQKLDFPTVYQSPQSFSWTRISSHLDALVRHVIDMFKQSIFERIVDSFTEIRVDRLRHFLGICSQWNDDKLVQELNNSDKVIWIKTGNILKITSHTINQPQIDRHSLLEKQRRLQELVDVATQLEQEPIGVKKMMQ